MSTYNPNVPTGLINLDNDYLNLQKNFQQINTTYAVDHIPLTNNTGVPPGGVNGTHNQVTNPIIIGSAHPTTSATVCKLYAMQDNASLPILQYSRAPSNAVPSPITNLNSPSTALPFGASTTTTFFTFPATPTKVFGHVLIADFVLNRIATSSFMCNGTTITLVNNTQNNAQFQLASAARDLKLIVGATAANDVYWTIKLYRLT